MVLFFVWTTLSFPAIVQSETLDPESVQFIISVLPQVAVFQNLDEAQLKKVAAVVEVVERGAGDRIIEQGKRIGKMAIPVDTPIQIRINGKIIRVFPENTLVGEVEFLEKVPATADVVLMKKSKVLLLPHGPFKRLMDDHPELGHRVMWEMSKMEAYRLRTNNP